MGTVGFGCGQCLPCRIHRRRMWSTRIYLESLCHERSAFVTLTYAPEKIPQGGSLEPRALQLFLKRLRFNSDAPLRFFGVGEYGDQTERPHYHLALYGLSALDARVVERSWRDGFAMVGDLTEQSAAYIAGYVTKKMTHASDPRLGGRHPEFARMSLRPGIGALAMATLASALNNQHGSRELRLTGDVPYQLRLGRKSLPLARYLRQRLRKEMCLEDDDTRAARDRFSLDASAEVLALLKTALDAKEVATPRSVILQRDLQKIRNVESRSKLKGVRML